MNWRLTPFLLLLAAAPLAATAERDAAI